ncbi:hypothetical protein L211DRAFT_675889 [Terfezia boudieri ATCC MYA-4762]|uniref:Uncharacterized protein n=1 Tax=Terfezia boudieri ATCC MYA-4762 TaxID=1051890 RepID=A0A3N4LU54_9PEZI|nr:hypothetical protein L211DRAFT_675889 [Terfezia boudieri ATCC MYA-4762]
MPMPGGKTRLLIGRKTPASCLFLLPCSDPALASEKKRVGINKINKEIMPVSYRDRCQTGSLDSSLAVVSLEESSGSSCRLRQGCRGTRPHEAVLDSERGKVANQQRVWYSELDMSARVDSVEVLLKRVLGRGKATVGASRAGARGPRLLQRGVPTGEHLYGKATNETG